MTLVTADCLPTAWRPRLYAQVRCSGLVVTCTPAQGAMIGLVASAEWFPSGIACISYIRSWASGSLLASRRSISISGTCAWCAATATVATTKIVFFMSGNHPLTYGYGQTWRRNDAPRPPLGGPSPPAERASQRLTYHPVPDMA